MFLARKKTGSLIDSSHKIAATIVSDFGRDGFSFGRGVCGYGVKMPTMEAAGNGGGGQVEGFRGVGKGERNGRKRYDNRRDIVLVLVTKIFLYYLPPPLLLPLACPSHP